MLADLTDVAVVSEDTYWRLLMTILTMMTMTTQKSESEHKKIKLKTKWNWKLKKECEERKT